MHCASSGSVPKFPSAADSTTAFCDSSPLATICVSGINTHDQAIIH
jgi:hypothetical protein